MATDRTTPGQEERAAKVAPTGYTLWATYPSEYSAERVKEVYGQPGDIIKAVPRSTRYALYAVRA